MTLSFSLEEIVGRMLAKFLGFNFLEVFVMDMATICRFPCWPLAPVFGSGIFVTLLAIAGVILSLVMLIDCLQRPREKFLNPLTKNGEYDKLIWAVAIVASLWIYFLGAIAYFFVVKRAKPEKSEE